MSTNVFPANERLIDMSLAAATSQALATDKTTQNSTNGNGTNDDDSMAVDGADETGNPSLKVISFHSSLTLDILYHTRLWE